MTWKKFPHPWDPVMLGIFHLPTSPMAGASTSMAATVLLSFAKPAQLQGFKNLDFLQMFPPHVAFIHDFRILKPGLVEPHVECLDILINSQ